MGFGNQVFQRESGIHWLLVGDASTRVQLPGLDRVTPVAGGLRIDQAARGEWFVEFDSKPIFLGEKWLTAQTLHVPDGQPLRLVAEDATTGDMILAVGPADVAVAVRNADVVDFVSGKHVASRRTRDDDLRVHVQSPSDPRPVTDTRTAGGATGIAFGPSGSAPEGVLFDEVVETDYGQFDLTWTDGNGFDGDFDRFFAGQVNGLVGAASADGVYINLARRSGGSPVRIVLLQTAPAPDLSWWEDVVEVSISVPSGPEPGWSTWAGEGSGPLDPPPGTYRLRASARGRDAGHEGEFADGAVDFYLIEIWPAPAHPDAIIQSRSADAEYWHRTVGGRR